MFRSLLITLFQTLKGRLLALILLMVVVIVFAIGVAYLSAKRSLQQQVIDSATYFLDFIELGVTDLIAITQMQLNVLAANPEIYTAECDKTLTQLMQNDYLKQHYTGFAVLGNQGQVSCSSYGQVSDEIVLHKLDMFRQAVATQDFAIGKLRLGELSQRFIIPVGLPVLDKNKHYAVISAAIRADTLQLILEKLPLPKYAAAFMLNQDGMIIAARHVLGSEYWHQKNINHSPLFELMQQGKAGSGSGPGLDGVSRFYAYEPFQTGEQRYFLLVTFEEAALLDSFFSNVKIAVAFAGGAITFTGIAILLTVYFFFLKKINGLVQDADTVIRDLRWGQELLFKPKHDWTHITEIERVRHSMQLVRMTLDERSKELLHAQKIAKLCSWKYLEATDEFYFSDGIRFILPGVTATGLLSEHFITHLPADEQYLLKQHLAQLLVNKTAFNCRLTYTFSPQQQDSECLYLEVHGAAAPSGQHNEVSFLGTLQDVTESTLLERSLSESQRFMKAVLDNLGESVVACNKQGRLELFNNITENLHGLPVKDIPLEQAPAYYSLYTEDGSRLLETSELPLYRAFSGEVFENVVIRIAPPNLPYRITKVRGQPIKDGSGNTIGAVVVQQDMTRVIETESRLQQKTQEFKRVFEAALDGLIVIDSGGLILLVNKTMASMHGYEANELIGLHSNVLFGETSWLNIKLSNTADTQQTAPRLSETQHRMGEKIAVEIVSSPMTIRGQQAVLCIVRDIRERKKTQERLNALLRIESIAKLTGGIAHDFNNLLQIILMNLDIVETELDNQPELKPMVTSALKAASKGGVLTQHLLAFTRQQALKIETLDINQLLESCRCLFDSIVKKNISLSMTLQAEPLWLHLDVAQFEIAITQLVMNAVDAIAEQGQIIIKTARAGADTIDCPNDSQLNGRDYAIITVTDNGCGMNDDIRKRAFEPFFTTKPVGAASGLGLSMVYGFVQQSGGLIQLQSEVNTGTTVALYFPLVADA